MFIGLGIMELGPFSDRNSLRSAPRRPPGGRDPHDNWMRPLRNSVGVNPPKEKISTENDLS